MAELGETLPRLPTGALPLDESEWSGDHRAIKWGMEADPSDNVFNDPDGNAWLENPDGTFTNCGSAADFTGSGKAQGRRGKDRGSRKKYPE